MYVNQFEKITNDLNQLSYNNTYSENLIEVDLGLGLLAQIIKKENKIEIKGFLNSWNPITGLFRMELEKSLKFNSIFLVLAFIVIFLTCLDNFPPTIFLIIFTQLITIHMITWYSYYLIKFYFFKHKIETNYLK